MTFGVVGQQLYHAEAHQQLRVGARRGKTGLARYNLHKLGLVVFLALVTLGTVAGSAEATGSRTVFVTLGTGGGPITKSQRSRPSNAVVVNGSVYLFDVGDGVQRQLVASNLSLPQLKAVFISHHHIDHNAGLGPLVVTRWVLNSSAPPLPIIGPPGTVSMTRQLIAAFGATEVATESLGVSPASPLKASLAPIDMPADANSPVEVYRDRNIRVLTVLNTHYHLPPDSAAAATARSYAFRIETPDRTIVFTGDTGPSSAVTALAKDADLLVSEVVDVPAVLSDLRRLGYSPFALAHYAVHMGQDHLTPVEVARMAAAAGVKKVVLTHLVPGDDNESSPAGYLKGIAPIYRGPVEVANDLGQY